MKTLILACLISVSALTKANTSVQQSPAKDSVVVKTEVFDPEVATQKYI
jgi:hypothetical protein